MKIFFILNFVCCKTNLVHKLVFEINKFITNNNFTISFFLAFSLFMLIFGLKFKFLTMSYLIGIFTLSTHEILVPHISNPKILDYFIYVLNHKCVLVLYSFAVAYCILVLFDIAIYAIMLFLIYHLYSLFVVDIDEVYVLIALVILGFMVRFLVKGFRDIVIALVFSIIGTFLFFLSFENFVNGKIGVLATYLDCLEWKFDIRSIELLCLQSTFSVISCILQLIINCK